jgi:peptidyl-dipeptidase A
MNRFTRAFLFLCLFCLFSIQDSAVRCQESLTREEKELKVFVEEYTKKAAPLEKEANLAEWNAYVTGNKADYEKQASLQLKLDVLHSNKEGYARFLAWKKSGAIKDPLLSRELSLLINAYGPKQISMELLKKINEKEAEVKRTFNTYRGEIDKKSVTDKDIYAILKESTDREQRKKAWLAQKGAGTAVAPLLKELVKLRNEAARTLGFKNYYEMTVQFDDQDLAELTSIFSQLYETTEKAFKENKGALDGMLAKRYGIEVRDLAPWDYPNPYFQEAPGIFAADTDRFFRDKDLPRVDTTFYDSIGLSLGDVLKRSDLYEKTGKSQHAFCYDIDRSGDTRILLNLRKDEDSCATLLHESGHAAYNLYIDRNLPWLLREPAHTFTTEASAMMFERLVKNPSWLQKMIALSPKEAALLKPVLLRDLALQQLLFCRWTEVMFNFEQELYRDPDQDLNTLWWTMVEKYQHLKKPEGRDEPDWASKIHLASAPVYYHNYMLGELMVSQMMHTMGTKVLGMGDRWSEMDFVKEPKTGTWLKENIYRPGARYRWNELIFKATGENLTPRYFAEQFISVKEEPKK